MNKTHEKYKGYYFSNLRRLSEIEDKINTFHKGNQNTLYDHFVDGIVLGEVGFPTLLYEHDLQFIGLPRQKYFCHL